MAKDTSKKKKVVKTSESGSESTKVVSTKKKLSPTQSRSAQKTDTSSSEMVFGRETYKWMGIGVLLLALGFIMMLGGYNEDPNVWDDSLIYSKRITVLAPVLILTGLGLQIYAIFKK